MALPSMLKGLPDMERGITRIFHRTADPAEFVQVLQALVNIAPQLGMQVSRLHALQAKMVSVLKQEKPNVYLCNYAACAVFKVLVCEVCCRQHLPCALFRDNVHFCSGMWSSVLY